VGDDGRTASVLPGLGYEGLVVEAFGGGHVPESMVDSLTNLVGSMPVVLASRTGAGVVLESTYGFAGGEIELLGRGLLSAGALDGLKARIALSVCLAGSSERTVGEARFRTIVTAIG
jgi:L-asparaginase